MNKIAYFDCPTGIAGDMCLGALVHAGVPLEYLIEKLHLLGISTEYQLRAELVHRNTQQATKFYVDLAADLPLKSNNLAADSALDPSETESPTFDARHHHHGEEHSHTHGEADAEISHTHHRHLPEIEQIIVAAKLPPRVEAWSLAVFGKLADAEAAVHGIPPSEVHFHEVGATDALVDIVGTCLGLDWLDIDEFYFSPMPTGGGTVKAAHGRLAVPTPAVMRLWETHRVPVYSNGIDRELCTPTGTAIACTLASAFGPPPPMQVQLIGLGAGSRNLAIPNILRLWIGEKEEGRRKKEEGRGKKEEGRGKKEEGRGKKEEGRRKKEEGRGEKEVFNQFPMPNSQCPMPHSQETVCVLETQIDDLNPQAIGYVFDALFLAGALDVFTTPIVMKKSRLGVLLSVICHPEFQDACEAVMFRETTTLGIRRSTQQRTILDREIQKVQTEYGEVQIKVAKSGETIVNVQPEYEDCAEIARLKNVSWREVHRLALQLWYDR
ncbi:MAG: nickel pincer cofactor biosynthesis protein LarC [Microcoleus sp. PH2017_25_DOB_D_A]|uniref:nickel pincer cofactor biosynthesis protein LarC n=1 Tax=unclassified Microcoleus TaxID=2642155 RepID=UPI001DE8F5A5|nr:MULTISPECIES: nickel pincer cofactor biosynthesis protein LarC [unclassified Microcoleus]TAE43947.1 MAG: nickel pincer cofactor biosynthesis protein LarC [Oscillatoriales cyanobacterium]MCC3447424.1 nickel pincer cofactor biosynthesis protein LarC [Microcoleus sp. PH2017_09_SFU_O_A]MCC3474176.1 nickel pincer cofactor biosynthesis protein LarC [Microcoleus sp. PH2017_13_LAR_U_A]MCC3486618.1 nickel pincer cofactor biosynthesis protein LarC [Microcoleus sp. PH2017_14_LAR_D_A]MCC3534227.1 nicke